MSDRGLHMVRLVLHRRPLLRLAARHGLRDGADEGAVLHAGLAAVFATSEAHAVVPMQPFAVDDVLTEQAANPEAVYLLGYSTRSEGELRTQLGPNARDLVAKLVTRRVDPIASGTLVGFRTRVCPTVRTKAAGEHGVRHDKRGRTKSREVDAWLAERLAHWRESPPSQWQEPFDVQADRERVYGNWLADELARLRPDARPWPVTAKAAELVPEPDRDGKPKLVRLVELRRDAFVRTRSGLPPGDGRRRGERPNAVLEGTLRVTDADAFRALLARGLGRHRAFGFGMLLLRRP
ncbi:MAG: hypothetical protein OHK0013_32690 [Sandaracinaceae bacterium]